MNKNKFQKEMTKQSEKHYRQGISENVKRALRKKMLESKN